jgi:hypothetical protein
MTAWFTNRLSLLHPSIHPRGFLRRSTGWWIILFLPLFLASTAACDIMGPGGPDTPQAQEGDLKILFIGASYLTVNDLPAIFESMAEAAGKEVFVGRRLQPGHYLDFFAQDPVTAEAIGAQEWDYVVVFGGCQTVGYPETHHLIMGNGAKHHPYPALEALKRKVQENHSQTRLVMIMPWAFEDGMTWIAGQGDDYFAMQEKIRENTLAWADALDFVVAPVGMAWKEVLEWGPPEHYLHASDWNHPAARGSYLAAAVVFSTLFRESSEGVSYKWVLTEADAAGFRKVASETVLDSLALWRIVP